MKLGEIAFPLPIAHRGFRAKYPENTQAAFRGALQIQAGMVELDVAMSRDRALVVIHDDTLERTTNGFGRVKDHTLAELKQLDAGSWFSPHFSEERIPTLRQVLELCRDKTLVNIEIKESFFEVENPPDAIEQQVIELVQDLGMVDQVLISSFEIGYLQRLSQQKNIPALAYLSLKPADDSVVNQCKALKLYSWHPLHDVVTESQVKMMHDAGLRVFTFTVNTDVEYRRLVGMGVDGVFSDNIPLITE